jgi:uncharacterized protein YegP (UPF0339 family)
MAKQKTVKKKTLEPGIHLYRTNVTKTGKSAGIKSEWYWNLITSNGRELARSSETYSSKGGAIKCILSVAMFFDQNQHYYDHTTRIAKDLNEPDLIVFELKD